MCVLLLSSLRHSVLPRFQPQIVSPLQPAPGRAGSQMWGVMPLGLLDMGYQSACKVCLGSFTFERPGLAGRSNHRNPSTSCLSTEPASSKCQFCHFQLSASPNFKLSGRFESGRGSNSASDNLSHLKQKRILSILSYLWSKIRLRGVFWIALAKTYPMSLLACQNYACEGFHGPFKHWQVLGGNLQIKNLF